MASVELVARARLRVFILSITVSAALLTVLSVAYLSTGPTPCSPWSQPCSSVLGLRAVRLAVAAFTGALLAVSGSLLQAVTRNVLADPYILGISSGALASVAATYLLLPLSSITPALLSATAFLGGFTAYTVVALVAEAAGGSASALVLAGVAVTAVLSGVAEALLTLLQVSRGFPFLTLLLGTAAYSSLWDAVTLALAASTVPLAAAMLAKPLNTLLLGDEYAHQLGYNPRRVRAISATLAALYASLTVSAVGVVGFVGLIAPNTARMVVGGDHRYSIPVAAVLGSTITLAADLAARMVASTAFGELPLGMYTSVAGGVFLAYLVASRARRGYTVEARG